MISEFKSAHRNDIKREKPDLIRLIGPFPTKYHAWMGYFVRRPSLICAAQPNSPTPNNRCRPMRQWSSR